MSDIDPDCTVSSVREDQVENAQAQQNDSQQRQTRQHEIQANGMTLRSGTQLLGNHIRRTRNHELEPPVMINRLESVSDVRSELSNFSSRKPSSDATTLVKYKGYV